MRRGLITKPTRSINDQDRGSCWSIDATGRMYDGTNFESAYILSIASVDWRIWMNLMKLGVAPLHTHAHSQVIKTCTSEFTETRDLPIDSMKGPAALCSAPVLRLFSSIRSIR